MSLAIITGASSGLGREFVRAIVRDHAEIDEFLLIARRRERLEALAAEFPQRHFHILPLDLTRPQERAQIQAFLQEQKADVRLLINNAGYGWLGNAADADAEGQLGMISLNCGALTALTSLLLPFMRRGGVILNVSSIAAFVPVPRMAVYAATKSYVLSYSRALREELKGKGINVLALCPGPMDTEFLDVAGITGKASVFDWLPRVSPRRMAEMSLKKAYAGRAQYTGRAFYKLYRVLAKLLPHGLLMKFTRA